MTNKEILQADLLDILFEHRNKLYGAYALRKTYTNRLGLALGAALSTVLVFVFLSFINGSKNGGSDNNDDRSMKLVQIEIPQEKPKEIEKPKEQPKSETKQVDYQTPTFVPDDKADPQPDLDDLRDSDIGNKNKDGDPSTGLADTTTKSTGDDTSGIKVPEKEPEPDLPSRQPSFPGGPEKWLEFLQRYLQAPESLDPGQRVEVQVRFWVDVDGSVSKAEIIKSGGSSFDKEVLRVMKKMPRWEPAMQKGKYVAVAYQQPVTFLGVEE